MGVAPSRHSAGIVYGQQRCDRAEHGTACESGHQLVVTDNRQPITDNSHQIFRNILFRYKTHSIPSQNRTKVSANASDANRGGSQLAYAD